MNPLVNSLGWVCREGCSSGCCHKGYIHSYGHEPSLHIHGRKHVGWTILASICSQCPSATQRSSLGIARGTWMKSRGPSHQLFLEDDCRFISSSCERLLTWHPWGWGSGRWSRASQGQDLLWTLFGCSKLQRPSRNPATCPICRPTRRCPGMCTLQGSCRSQCQALR